MRPHKKEQLINIIEFFGNFVPNNVEIVLHIIEDGKSYIAKIINSHVSGRTIDSELTDLAKGFLRDQVYKDRQSVKNYKGVTADNKILNASTFFVKTEDNELEAMICFNVDIEAYKELANQLNQLVTISNTILDKNYKCSSNNATISFDEDFVEHFSDTLKNEFFNILSLKNYELEQLTSNQRQEIALELHSKGYFEFKGTVPQLSELMNVSEPTIYRYIKQSK